jgi:hypothetical protein
MLDCIMYLCFENVEKTFFADVIARFGSPYYGTGLFAELAGLGWHESSLVSYWSMNCIPRSHRGFVSRHIQPKRKSEQDAETITSA